MVLKQLKRGAVLISLTAVILLAGLFIDINRAEASTGSGTNGTVSFCGPDKNNGSKPTCVTATCAGSYTYDNCAWTSTCTVNGVNANTNWKNVGVTFPECYDGCQSSRSVCPASETCQGTTCAPCPTGTVLNYGTDSKGTYRYCSSVCSADTPCTSMLNGKYCRKMGSNSYSWVSTQYCTQDNFCQTFQCCTSDYCSYVSDSKKGYCGFDGNSNLTWLDTGSASCPYTLSVNRDKSHYQMFSECYDNTTPWDTSGCDTGDMKVIITGPNHVAAAKLLQSSRVDAPWNEHGYVNVYGLASYPSYTSTASSSTYDYIFPIPPAGPRSTIPISKENCCMPGSSGCVLGGTAPGNYLDNWKLGVIVIPNSFDINCTPPSCSPSGCIPNSGGGYCLNPPTNTTVCSGDNSGLTTNITSTVVASASSCTTATKCEYYCNTGYVKSGTSNTCVSTGGTYSCLTPPANATICPNDGSGLTANINSIVVPMCTTTTKCEYQCNPGYKKSGNACVNAC